MHSIKQISFLSQDAKIHLHLIVFFLKSLRLSNFHESVSERNKHLENLMKILFKRILSNKTLFYCNHEVAIYGNVFESFSLFSSSSFFLFIWSLQKLWKPM